MCKWMKICGYVKASMCHVWNSRFANAGRGHHADAFAYSHDSAAVDLMRNENCFKQNRVSKMSRRWDILQNTYH